MCNFNDGAWNGNCYTGHIKNLDNTKGIRLVIKSKYLIGATWKLQVKIGITYSLFIYSLNYNINGTIRSRKEQSLFGNHKVYDS